MFNEVYPCHHDVEHPGGRRHVSQHSHPAVVASQAGQELGEAVGGELVVAEQRLGQGLEERVVLQQVDVDQEPLVILGQHFPVNLVRRGEGRIDSFFDILLKNSDNLLDPGTVVEDEGDIRTLFKVKNHWLRYCRGQQSVLNLSCCQLMYISTLVVSHFLHFL